MDLDFLSNAFVSPGSKSPTTSPVFQLNSSTNKPPAPKGIADIEKSQQHIDLFAGMEKSQHKNSQTVSTIKVPQQVADKIVDQANTNRIIVSTQRQETSSPTHSPVSRDPVVASVPPKSVKKMDEMDERIPCKKVVNRSLLVNGKAEMFIVGH